MALAHSIRKATMDDAFSMAPRMREADINELHALHGPGHTPITGLIDGIAYSDEAQAVIYNDRPAAMFGVGPFQGVPGTGLVWLLGTDDILKFARSFLRDTRNQIEKLHEHYPTLTNVVHAENELHVRWLEWAGFSFTRTFEEFGIGKSTFIEFIRNRTE